MLSTKRQVSQGDGQARRFYGLWGKGPIKWESFCFFYVYTFFWTQKFGGAQKVFREHCPRFLPMARVWSRVMDSLYVSQNVISSISSEACISNKTQV